MSTTFAGPNWKVVWTPETMDRKIDRAWPIAVRAVLARARANAPKRTGFMSRSIRAQVQKRSATIISPAPYSLFVEKGTRPHVILPVRASVLAFEVGGQMVFAKKVNHPGTKAQPFLMPAADILPLAFSSAMR